MISKYLIPLLWICLLAVAGSAQTSYSESAEYRPRPVATPTPKKDRKKKSPDKDAAKDKGTPLAVPNISGDKIIAGDIIVTIPVSVLDRLGSAVGGLTRNDVSVFVDGTEVPIVAFEQDKEPVTMVLVLDSSPSAQLRFKAMREQALKLVGELPSNMKVMVVDFNTKLNVRSQPTTNRDVTRNAISKVSMGDGTSIYSAVQFMYEKLLPTVPGRKVIVVMTDGVDTTSQNSDFAKSLTEVEKQDVTVYPIYVDTFGDSSRVRSLSNDWIAQILRQSNIPPGRFPIPGASEAEYKTGLIYLNDLAAASGGRIFSSEKLGDGTRSLLGELANRYYVTITVPIKNIGSRPVRVRVNRPSLAVFARGSFFDL